MGRKETKKEKTIKTSIGGQAVIEGVMMRGEKSMAIAVRDNDGVIRLETKRVKPAYKRNLFLRLPIIRGMVSFFLSLVGGVKTLMRSADVFGESEPTKFEAWLSKKLKIDATAVVTTFAMIVGVALAVLLFVFLPQALRRAIEAIVGNGFAFDPWGKNFIEGAFKIIVFISYILLCSLIKDVKRVFMYHGAEHKTITCYEKGLPLTVENARKCKRVHDRCGTTFIFFVLTISIILFALFEALLAANNVKLDGALRILCKIAMLPFVAGISYELLKALAKTDCALVYPLKAPGLLLQKITTKEPDDKMLEVAIASFLAVKEMDEDESIPEKKFITAMKCKDLTESVKKRLSAAGIDEVAEAEWIVSLTLKIKRDEVYSEKTIFPKKIEEINKLADQRITGRPLWYCIGNTDFYGYNIDVDERVLIPRPETELLCEKAIKFCKEDSEVLDLCTGSGAIAVTLNKETGAMVTATDVSEDALNVAKGNAVKNGASVEFIESDLFSALKDRKFNVIVSNPPYIPSAEISSLQREVKDFEPSLALDGGDDGLDFYRKICKAAPEYLKSNGVLIMECGIGQAQSVVKMLKKFSKTEIIKDYENIDRIVLAVL